MKETFQDDIQVEMEGNGSPALLSIKFFLSMKIETEHRETGSTNDQCATGYFPILEGKSWLAHREFFEIQINQPCQTL
jgi:hypothetical protein